MARTKAVNRLETYREKRDFSRTPEPAPDAPAKAGKGRNPMFCVQKHLARALHYDFRLEHAGVLLSWAVPKGPSLNPADKRMAMRTEDHPIAYGDFEGVIPSGYGAGVVMLWDKGTWEPEGTASVSDALAKGELKFKLDGVKLKGSWVLVRLKPRSAGDRESWLLIKHRDHWSGGVDVTAAAPDSVKSFVGMREIAASSDKSLPAGFAARIEDMQKAKSPPAEKPVSERSRQVPTTRRAAPKAAETPAKFTNLAKILYPAIGFTKGDLIDYYRRAASTILPHLRGRGVTLKRYPDGVEGKSFFEKHCPAHRPAWVKTVRFQTKSKTIDHCLIEDERSLLWAANLAAIELHVPLALSANPDVPTSVVFDLDPGPPADLKQCAKVALRLKALLDGLKLTAVVKTSGGKGLHVLVPLNTPDTTFDATKSFARAVALTLQKDDPKGVVATMAKSERPGKVFVDWGQNDREKTTVCAYSVRAGERPFISAPIAWEALAERKAPRPLLAQDASPAPDGADPLQILFAVRQRLPAS